MKWTGKGKKRAYKKVQRRVVKAKNDTEKKAGIKKENVKNLYNHKDTMRRYDKTAPSEASHRKQRSFSPGTNWGYRPEDATLVPRKNEESFFFLYSQLNKISKSNLLLFNLSFH